MSQPPKPTSLAPRARCSSSSGECRRSGAESPGEAPGAVAGDPGASVEEGTDAGGATEVRLGGGRRGPGEAVLGEQRFVVSLVQQLHPDARVQLLQAAHLGVLAGD